MNANKTSLTTVDAGTLDKFPEGDNYNYNISLLITESSCRFPYKRSLVVPVHKDLLGRYAYSHLTYEQLEKEVHYYAWGFKTAGISNDDKVLVTIAPGFNLVIVLFALFRLGAVPVLIDEGMGEEGMISCIEELKPSSMVVNARVLRLRKRFPKSFSTICQSVSVEEEATADSLNLYSLRNKNDLPFPAAHKDLEDLTLILFTTGSTGTPKGVECTPRSLRRQVEVSRRTWKLTPQDIDLHIFPPFIIPPLFIGMTAVIPDMNAIHPSQVNPANVVQQIKDHGVTNSFGSPVMWDKITRYCLDNNIQLPSIRNIVISGAPVLGSTIRRFPQILPQGLCNTPLGSTETFALTNITSDEIIGETLILTEQGKGVCIGYPVVGVEIRVIEITDEPIPTWDQAHILKQGEEGELVAIGPVLSHGYFQKPEATKMAKIYDKNGCVVAHRLGDTGFIDEKGRIWFCGRKAHIVIGQDKRWFPVKIEASFNSESDIWRTALVNVEVNGKKELVLFIEFEPSLEIKTSQIPDQRLISLKAKAKQMKVPVSYFFACPEGFPVDIRHNAKIARPKLSLWAQQLVEKKLQM